jgi:hypothetical protein
MPSSALAILSAEGFSIASWRPFRTFLRHDSPRLWAIFLCQSATTGADSGFFFRFTGLFLAFGVIFRYLFTI